MFAAYFGGRNGSVSLRLYGIMRLAGLRFLNSCVISRKVISKCICLKSLENLYWAETKHAYLYCNSTLAMVLNQCWHCSFSSMPNDRISTKVPFQHLKDNLPIYECQVTDKHINHLPVQLIKKAVGCLTDGFADLPYHAITNFNFIDSIFPCKEPQCFNCFELFIEAA